MARTKTTAPRSHDKGLIEREGKDAFTGHRFVGVFVPFVRVLEFSSISIAI